MGDDKRDDNDMAPADHRCPLAGSFREQRSETNIFHNDTMARLSHGLNIVYSMERKGLGEMRFDW